MSEATILSGLKTALLSMEEFASGEVVIDDWDLITKGETQASPFVILETSNEFVSRQDTQTPDTIWQIVLFLLVEYDGRWETSKAAFRTARQAIIDKINTSSVRSAGGLAGVTIDEVRSNGPIGYYFEPQLDPDDIAYADPLYLVQEIILSAEEY